MCRPTIYSQLPCHVFLEFLNYYEIFLLLSATLILLVDFNALHARSVENLLFTTFSRVHDCLAASNQAL